MALDPKRIRKVKFTVNTGRVVRKSQRARAQAMRALAAEMQTEIKEVLDVQGTSRNRSLPGEPPRKQRGNLQRNTTVKLDKKNEIAIRTTNVGILLDGGTKNIEPRPFIRTTIHDKRATWQRRFGVHMRRFSK